MTPEELVLQLKKKGTFDELRKQALQDFQANELGQAFINQINQILEKLETEDPALFAKDKSFVHNVVLDRLENNSVYDNARRGMLENYLQSTSIASRIDDEIRTLAPQEKECPKDEHATRQRERSSSKESGEAED